MISKVEGASSSKKIQRGLVALVTLLLAGALFVGAGAAVGVNVNGGEIELSSISGMPTSLAKEDKLTLNVDISSPNVDVFTNGDVKLVVKVLDKDGNVFKVNLSSVKVTWTGTGCSLLNNYGLVSGEEVTFNPGRSYDLQVSKTISQTAQSGAVNAEIEFIGVAGNPMELEGAKISVTQVSGDGDISVNTFDVDVSATVDVAALNPTQPPAGNNGGGGGGSVIQPTQTPTPTPTQTQGGEVVPTDVPTTSQPTEAPKSPAFGVLAVLAGLGAVAVLRKD